MAKSYELVKQHPFDVRQRKEGCYVAAVCHSAQLQSERQHSRPPAVMRVARQSEGLEDAIRHAEPRSHRRA